MTLLVPIGIIWVKFLFLFALLRFYFYSGEYLKDLDGTIIPQDPLLMHKVPIPIVEKGACGGIWQNLEFTWDYTTTHLERDCWSTYEPADYLQPLSKLSSSVPIIKFLYK